MLLQVDLKKIGISNFGELESGGLGTCANDKLELQYEDNVGCKMKNLTYSDKRYHSAGNGSGTLSQPHS